MPPKLLVSEKLKIWINDLPPNERKNFRIEDKRLFCNVCSRLYTFERKNQLTQHLETQFHKKSIAIAAGTGERQLLFGEEAPGNQFHQDLCQMLVAANIPFNKLENPYVQGFIEKYCKRPCPGESTIRKCLKTTYDAAIVQIRKAAESSRIWMGVDETTDKCGRFVVNVMFGCLDGSSTRPYLLMSREVEKANNTTITQLVLDALHFLWPGKKEAEINQQFCIFLSDAVPYMMKAAQNLKNTYNGLMHVTCLAHGLNRVAETIRQHFDTINTLLGSVKAVFKKAPSRVRVYHEKFPNLALPPEPVLTRWGTWLEAVDFYALNFDSIKTVIDALDPEDALSIGRAQTILRRPEVKLQLADLSANYTFIARSIEKLEKRELLLTDAVGIIDDVRTCLARNNTTVGKMAYSKLVSVLTKNPDFEKMNNVANVLTGSYRVDLDMPPDLIANLKYCPLTSVELERGFSMEKALLSDRNRKMTIENLEMRLVSQFQLQMLAKK